MTSSSLHEAHAEIVERLRELLGKAVDGIGETLVPVGASRALLDALREVDRMEGIGRDWEQAMDDCLARERGLR